MTTATITEDVRCILQDDKSPFRWSDSEIRTNLKYAIRELHKLRPETRYPNGVLVDFVDIPSSDTASIQIDDRFADCLTYYVVYRCYLVDDSDTVNAQLAESYLARFNTGAQL